MALRYKRDLQQEAWETHGRELTEKYSTRGNQEHVRQLKQEIADEKARVGTELRNFLKQAKKDTDDGIHQVNTERVRRVYAETAHPVCAGQSRPSSRGDGIGRTTYEQVLRRGSARSPPTTTRTSSAPASSTRIRRSRPTAPCSRSAMRSALRIPGSRLSGARNIIAQREAVQERVRLENRDVHDQIDLASLISEKVVAHSILSGKGEVTEGSEDALATFSRFFGFKRTLREKDGVPLNYRRGRIRTKEAHAEPQPACGRVEAHNALAARRSRPDSARYCRDVRTVSKQFSLLCGIYAV